MVTKYEKIYNALDEMVKTLNEQKRRLAVKAETGQLTNAERHEKLNSLYVSTLHSVAKDIEQLAAQKAHLTTKGGDHE